MGVFFGSDKRLGVFQNAPSLKEVTMSNVFSSLIVLIIGFLLSATAFYKRQNLENKLIRLFVFMNIAMGIFAFGYAFELISSSIKSFYIGLKLQYIGLSFLSIFWIYFALKLKNNIYPKLETLGFLLIVPITTCFLVMTNESHELFYSSINYIQSDDFSYFSTTKGPFYFFYILYTYAVLAYLGITLLFSYKNNKFQLKIQNKNMLIGLAIASFLNLLYILKLSPVDLDLTPVGFLFISIYINKAIKSFEFLDIKDVIYKYSYGNIGEGILVLNSKNKIVDYNNAASNMLGIFDEKSFGRFIYETTLGAEIYEKSKKDIFEIVIENHKNSVFEFKKSEILVDKRLIAYFYIISDITEKKNILRDLTLQATSDYLTGTLNRLGFFSNGEKELSRVTRYGGQFSLIAIDIDYFKKVNDTYGHGIGDEALKHISALITQNLRVSDSLGRLGGEEFGIILAETSLENAILYAEKIRKLIEESPVCSNEICVPLTISLGLTHYSQDSGKVEFADLLEKADKALYTSKNSGRNRYSVFNGFQG